jgi:hypothetical protein
MAADDDNNDDDDDEFAVSFATSTPSEDRRGSLSGHNISTIVMT